MNYWIIIINNRFNKITINSLCLYPSLFKKFLFIFNQLFLKPLIRPYTWSLASNCCKCLFKTDLVLPHYISYNDRGWPWHATSAMDKYFFPFIESLFFYVLDAFNEAFFYIFLLVVNNFNYFVFKFIRKWWLNISSNSENHVNLHDIFE